MHVCVRPGVRKEELVGLSFGESAVGCQCSLSWCVIYFLCITAYFYICLNGLITS